MSERFVDVEGVTKRFDENTVLDEVNLTVAEHEVVCLIGASGSGKSTLLRCLNLLEKVQAGHDHDRRPGRSPRARSTSTRCAARSASSSRASTSSRT